MRYANNTQYKADKKNDMIKKEVGGVPPYHAAMPRRSTHAAPRHLRPAAAARVGRPQQAATRFAESLLAPHPLAPRMAVLRRPRGAR